MMESQRHHPDILVLQETSQPILDIITTEMATHDYIKDDFPGEFST